MLHSAEEPLRENSDKGAEFGHDSGRSGRDASPSAGKAAGADRDMGSALRSIYQRTIEEDIPDEMLSLLGKLD